ncbi:MAG: hypothetical protein M3487_11915, partial [Actinomycetota bacterium]|nr:hypothetical protein [Actinomycetota bacterium]
MQEFEDQLAGQLAARHLDADQQAGAADLAHLRADQVGQCLTDRRQEARAQCGRPLHDAFLLHRADRRRGDRRRQRGPGERRAVEERIGIETGSGAEQHLVIDASIYDGFLAELVAVGTHVVPLVRSAEFVATAFLPQGALRMAYIGQSAAVIAAHAGLDALDGCRLVAFEAEAEEGGDVGGAGATERLAPIVTLYRTARCRRAVPAPARPRRT